MAECPTQQRSYSCFVSLWPSSVSCYYIYRRLLRAATVAYSHRNTNAGPDGNPSTNVHSGGYSNTPTHGDAQADSYAPSDG